MRARPGVLSGTTPYPRISGDPTGRPLTHSHRDFSMCSLSQQEADLEAQIETYKSQVNSCSMCFYAPVLSKICVFILAENCEGEW